MKNFIKNHPLWSIMIFAVIVRLIILGSSFIFSSGPEKGLVNFDGAWYLDIAKNGYDTDYTDISPTNLLCNQGTGFCQRNFAFFPLYPITTSALHSVTGISYELSGILISNFAFLISVFLLFKLVKKLFNQKLAIKTTLIFSLFPLSYVFSAFMSESLFLMLLLSTLLFTYDKKYIFAGICGALLSATRNTGVLVLIPMILIFASQQKQLFSWKNWKTYLGFAIVPLGVLAFALYLNSRIGDPFAFIHIQSYWEKPVGGIHPILAIPYSFINSTLEGSLGNHIYNVGWFVILIGLFLISIKKKLVPFSLSNILLWIFVPLLAGSMLAIPRYLTVLFPIYMIIAKLIKNTKILALLCSIFFIGLLILTFFYYKGYWFTV